MKVSYDCRSIDTVDAAAFLFGRGNREPGFFFSVPKKTPRTVWRCHVRVRQRFNAGPQLIDQRLAIADFPPLFDTGQRIPQCQEPLAAKRRGV